MFLNMILISMMLFSFAEAVHNVNETLHFDLSGLFPFWGTIESLGEFNGGNGELSIGMFDTFNAIEEDTPRSWGLPQIYTLNQEAVRNQLFSFENAGLTDNENGFPVFGLPGRSRPKPGHTYYYNDTGTMVEYDQADLHYKLKMGNEKDRDEMILLESPSARNKPGNLYYFDKNGNKIEFDPSTLDAELNFENGAHNSNNTNLVDSIPQSNVMPENLYYIDKNGNEVPADLELKVHNSNNTNLVPKGRLMPGDLDNLELWNVLASRETDNAGRAMQRGYPGRLPLTIDNDDTHYKGTKHLCPWFSDCDDANRRRRRTRRKN